MLDEQLQVTDAKISKGKEKAMENQPPLSDDNIQDEANESSEDHRNERTDEEIVDDGVFPDDIRNFRPPCVRQRRVKNCNDDCSASDDDDEEPDLEEDEDQIKHEQSVGKKKRKKSGENLTSKRFVALLMIFPMVVTGAVMLYESFGKLKLKRSLVQGVAVVCGAAIALTAFSFIPAARSALKLSLCFAWLLFLVPSYQVYTCSPVELKNEMVGTWFSLKTDARSFLESSHKTSACFKSLPFHTPYALSLISTKISLKVNIDDVVSLTNNAPKVENGGKSTGPEDTASFFMFVSKRSVKRKYHKLHLLAEASPDAAALLKKALKLSRDEKAKNMLMVTGAVANLNEAFSPLKKELEGMNYLIRPIKLHIESVKYVDRYAKMHHDDNMY